MSILNRVTVLAAWTVVASALSRPAHADYFCRALDPPGASEVQAWQINNRGQVAVSSSLGGFIYSAGAWEPLPNPPASSGLTAKDLGPLGLNDFGSTAGGASPATGGPVRGFLLHGGEYHFFSYPSTTLVNTQPRAMNNRNLVTGYAAGIDGRPDVGFVYNPSGATGYKAGFTEVVPTLNGQRSAFTIPGAINSAGRFVGSARFPGHGGYGFLYDPGAQPPISLFQVNGWPTRGRGINNRGQIVGFYYDPEHDVVGGYLRDSKGVRLIACPELNSTGFFTQSINDSGLISGSFEDADGGSHGFIGYPDVRTAIEDLEGAVTGVGPGQSLEAKMDSVARSYAAGKIAGACGALRAFVSEVAAQSGKKVPANQAASFTAEAQSIMKALGCK